MRIQPPYQGRKTITKCNSGNRTLLMLAARCRLIRFPENFFGAELYVGPTAPNKKSVAQAIEILHSKRWRRILPRERNTQSFCPPANRPANMKNRIDLTAARKHER